MPTIKVNDINIYFETHGVGFPLFMILGLSCDVNWWTPEIINATAQNFKTIIFDNRGIGRTDKPEMNYSIKMFADDTIGLMNTLNIQKAHILGLSMGGFIAQEIALSYPKRVEKLVLCCTHCGGGKALAPSKEALSLLLNPPEEPIAYINAIIPLLFTKTFIESNPDFIESYKKRILKIPFNISLYKRQLQAIGFNSARRLQNIDIPTLILHGENDIFVPPGNAEILAKGIPNARKVILDNAAHFLFQPDTEKVTNLICKFLTKKVELEAI